MTTKAQLKERIEELEAKVDFLMRNVEDDTTVVEEIDFGIFPFYDPFTPFPKKKVTKVTLNGRVNAIAKHLGLTVAVEQPSVKKVPAKVVVNTKPKTVAKKNVAKKGKK